MNRRIILPVIGISGILFWLLWIFVFPRYIPQISHYGFFFPFVFFFPFLGRGRRGKRTGDSGQRYGTEQEKDEGYSSDSMLADDFQANAITTRNLVYYLIGMLILAGGILLVYLRLY